MRKGVPSRGGSQCKGPGVGGCWAWLKQNKPRTVGGKGRAGGAALGFTLNEMGTYWGLQSRGGTPSDPCPLSGELTAGSGWRAREMAGGAAGPGSRCWPLGGGSRTLCVRG